MYSHFVDYNNPNSFASRARQKRSLLLRTLIDECFDRQGHVAIVDMGGEARYWSML